jgi:hypothetical protein
MLSSLLNLKALGIALGALVIISTFVFIKGCDYGKAGQKEDDEKEIAELNLKYERLVNAPPVVKSETTYVYRTRKAQSGTSASIPETSEPGDFIAQLSVPKYTEFYVEGAGVIGVHHYPLKILSEQFSWEVIKPEPQKMERVEVTVTKTAIEYVDISVFEKAEFYLSFAVAAIAGYAVAGGF